MTADDRKLVAIAALVLVLPFLLAGCAAPEKQVVIEKPVPVRVAVPLPAECRNQYAVDTLRPGADPVQINRAILAEINQRRACEVRLRAALEAGANE